MRKSKFTMLSIAFLVLSSLHATKPIEKSNEKFANSFISKLSVEVTLTDSQKVQIMRQVMDYSLKMDSISKTTNETIKSSMRANVSALFEQSLDSLLTKDQKSILESNRTQRINTISKKYQSKK